MSEGELGVWRIGEMRTRLKLKPGQDGTKKLTAEYGDRLVCVRYRYDRERRKRYKTVELIVDEAEWEPNGRWVGQIVAVAVGNEPVELRRQLLAARGVWHAGKGVWLLHYEKVLALGLEGQVVGLGVEVVGEVSNHKKFG